MDTTRRGPDQSHSWVYYYVITTTGSDNYYLWPRVCAIERETERQIHSSSTIISHWGLKATTSEGGYTVNERPSIDCIAFVCRQLFYCSDLVHFLNRLLCSAQSSSVSCSCAPSMATSDQQRLSICPSSSGSSSNGCSTLVRLLYLLFSLHPRYRNC